MPLGIITLSIMTRHNDTQLNEALHYITQHNDTAQ